MRKGGGHGKGAEFERKIAKEIVKAFRKKFKWVKQNDCWRSVLSGGHEMSAGDLEMTPRMEKLFPYAVECKFHKKVHWWHFLMPHHKKRTTWQEWKWLQQAVEGAEKRKGLKPILVVHCNNGPVIVVRPPEPCESGWRYDLWKDFLKQAVEDARE